MWKSQRWFMLRYMRDYGFGRRHELLECQIRDEIMTFIDILRNGPKYKHEHGVFKNGGLAKVPLGLSAALENCFLQVVSMDRIPREEQASLFEYVYIFVSFQQ